MKLVFYGRNKEVNKMSEYQKLLIAEAMEATEKKIAKKIKWDSLF